MRRKLWGRTCVWEQWASISPIILMVVILLMILYPVRMLHNVIGRVQDDDSKIQANSHEVFVSPLAGSWYEADKERLAKELDGYLEKVTSEKRENVHALILPHAGYRWSGQTAAYGIKHIQGGKFSRVIVMGPSHRVPMLNTVSVPSFTHLKTPLGEVPLDLEFIKSLKKHHVVKTIPEAHDGEHSVQIEVPLLQKVLGEFKLVPIIAGDLDIETTKQLAQALLGLIDEKTLVVVSSDFTHYGPSFRYVPFRDNVKENLRKLAMDAYSLIEKKDLKGFTGHINKTGDTICGRIPVGVLLAMLPDGSKANLEAFDTSGNMSGDYNNSVSYLSVTFSGKWEKGKPMENEAANQTLSDNDKQLLLKLARATLTYVVENKTMPTPDELDIELTPIMKETMGAFVTLKKHGQLRGCIGEIIPRRPLYEAIMTQAVNAGLRDPRFPKVQLDEIAEIRFDISAYASAPIPVDSCKDIVIGKHGMVLEKEGRQALFLPQVATEQGWDLDQTLTHLSMKAGLADDAWKEGASFSVFEAIVFGEEE